VKYSATGLLRIPSCS